MRSIPLRPAAWPLLLAASGLLATAALLVPEPAAAQRRARRAEATPRLTEETLVPEQVFPVEDARRFGYPMGLEVTYSRTEGGHRFKLVEKPLSLASPSPSPSPAAAPEGEATPTPEPTPTPSPTPATLPGVIVSPPPLPPTAAEPDFVNRVGLIRPTVVSVVFAESAEAASQMVADLRTAKSDEAARPQLLAFDSLEEDKRVAANAFVYRRQVDLGKGGGLRRAVKVVFSKGNAFVDVDAELGLRDGQYEAQYPTLEKRARDVAGYLARKL